MVGGGPGAGIAETHRTAMRLDDRYELVAGAFSRDREKSLAAARQLRIHAERIYSDYTTMAAAEAKREDRIDAVVIVTPTASHYEIAKVFLEAGINVICDKPLCLSLAEARELKSMADKGGLTVSAAWPLWKEPCVPQRPAGSGRCSKAFEIRKATGRRMQTIAVVVNWLYRFRSCQKRVSAPRSPKGHRSRTG
jgi:predicted dehydrogenase